MGKWECGNVDLGCGARRDPLGIGRRGWGGGGVGKEKRQHCRCSGAGGEYGELVVTAERGRNIINQGDFLQGQFCWGKFRAGKISPPYKSESLNCRTRTLTCTPMLPPGSGGCANRSATENIDGSHH